MSLVASTVQAFEGAPLPDAVRKAAIGLLVAGARRQAAGAGPDADARFAREMAERPIAEHTGEAVADGQMKAFRASAGHKGQVMDRGLWSWSRHPNYFFQWLGWLAYPVIALDPARPLTWLSLAAPVVMYGVLRYVSGVPPLEAAMLKSRGERFRDYQARVSVFFPLPPRKPQSA